MTAWTVVSIDRVIDGDSLRLTRSRVVGAADGLTITATDTSPIAVRLVHLDTPERGQYGYAAATDDLQRWLHDQLNWTGLTLHDAGRDNFGRILADLHTPDGDSATLHMIRDRGWSPWMPR